jgi:hypothetical protein
LRVAVIGGINAHKGRDILLACARDARARRLPLQFVVIGYTDKDDLLRKTSHVTITGRYRQEEVFDLLESQRCHCAFLPSIWPETWSYTLSIAFRARLLPIVFDIGVQASRIREVGFGHTLLMTSDGKHINNELLSLIPRLTEPWPDLSHAFPTYQNLLGDYYDLNLATTVGSRDAA